MEGSDSHRHMGDASADYAIFRLKAIECLEVAWEHKENCLVNCCLEAVCIFFLSALGGRHLLFSHLKLNEMGLQELLCCWTCVYYDLDAGNWNLNDDRKSV